MDRSVFCLALGAGCATASEEGEPNADAGAGAALLPDAAAPSGVRSDAGTGPADAGPVDAGQGPADAGPADAAPGPADAAQGPADAAQGDADASPDPAPVPADAAPAPSCGAAVGELLANGNFDGISSSPWIESSGAAPPYALRVSQAELAPLTVAPHSGSHAVWLGGYLADAQSSGTDSLSQEVVVPAAATGALTVTGAFWAVSEESQQAWDTLRLELRSPGGALLEVLGQWSNLDEGAGWSYFSRAAVGDYSGETVLLRWESQVDDSLNTNFFLDSLGATVACP